MTELTQEEKAVIEVMGTSRKKETVTIPGDLAVRCEHCGTVSDSTGHDCPKCGHGPLVNLARLLDRGSERQRAAEIVNKVLARGHGSKQRTRLVAEILGDGN